MFNQKSDIVFLFCENTSCFGSFRFVPNIVPLSTVDYLGNVSHVAAYCDTSKRNGFPVIRVQIASSNKNLSLVPWPASRRYATIKEVNEEVLKVGPDIAIIFW